MQQQQQQQRHTDTIARQSLMRCRDSSRRKQKRYQILHERGETAPQSFSASVSSSLLLLSVFVSLRISLSPSFPGLLFLRPLPCVCLCLCLSLPLFISVFVSLSLSLSLSLCLRRIRYRLPLHSSFSFSAGVLFYVGLFPFLFLSGSVSFSLCLLGSRYLCISLSLSVCHLLSPAHQFLCQSVPSSISACLPFSVP